MEINSIIQGECLEVLKSWEDNCVDYTITSPPYNNKTNRIVNKGKSFYDNYQDNMDDEHYFEFIKNILKELMRVTKKYTFFNVMYNVDNKDILCKLLGHYAPNIKDILIWKKPLQPAMCSNVLTHNFEFIFVFSKENENRKYEVDFGRRGEYTTCFEEMGNSIINRERFDCEGNFAVMSIQVARRLVKTFTQEGNLILDPFMGSGTTAVACKQLSRNYIGIELIPETIEIAQDRINNQPTTLFK